MPKSDKINCVNGLKSVGQAFQLWAGDNNDKFPMQVSISDTNGGGTMELAATGNVAATFQILKYQLATPKILICPADTKSVLAIDFTNNFTCKNISYFIGLDADQSHPETLLSGDDNFAIGGVPVESGLLKITTNTPIVWTSARHKYAGNIGYADGSVQQVNSKIEQVNTKRLQSVFDQTGLATNRLAIP
jgi:prepilin-type processing-associated H-X9-DG protein